MDRLFEIKCRDQWLKVRYDIFRSWTGERKIDGAPYHGPVVELGESVEGAIGPKEVAQLIEWEIET